MVQNKYIGIRGNELQDITSEAEAGEGGGKAVAEGIVTRGGWSLCVAFRTQTTCGKIFYTLIRAG